MKKEEQFFEEMKPLLSEYMEYDNIKEVNEEEWKQEKADMELAIKNKSKQIEKLAESRVEAVENLKEAKETKDKISLLKRGKETNAYKGAKEDFSIERIHALAENREYKAAKRELNQMQEKLQVRESKVKEAIRISKEKAVKKEEIFHKAQEFVSTNKEQMRKDISKKEKELEKAREDRLNAKKELQSAKEMKTLALKRGEESHAYKGAKEDFRIAYQDSLKKDKTYKLLEQELAVVEANLEAFEKKYDVIDFASEAGIQSLIAITGWKEESVLVEEKSKEEQKRKEIQSRKGKPKTDGTKKVEPKTDGTKKVEPKVDGTKKVEPKVDGTKKVEPKVDGTKKVEPKVDEPKKDAQPTQAQTGTSQILQGVRKEMPIDKIEVDTNKAKVSVYMKGKEPIEYSMRDIIWDRNDLLLKVEKSVKDADIFNKRSLKQRETIIKSADIFVLKALYEYSEKVKDTQMLKDYLKNIDIVHGITRLNDDEQMSLPRIIHNVEGRSLSKTHYKEALRQINKDKGIDSAQLDESITEKLSILGKWIRRRNQRKVEMTYEERKEKEEAKARKKQEKQEKSARDRRERGVAKACRNTAKKEALDNGAKATSQKTRKNLGMEYVEVDHGFAIRSAEEKSEGSRLVSKKEMEEINSMMNKFREEEEEEVTL